MAAMRQVSLRCNRVKRSMFMLARLVKAITVGSRITMAAGTVAVQPMAVHLVRVVLRTSVTLVITNQAQQSLPGIVTSA